MKLNNHLVKGHVKRASGKTIRHSIYYDLKGRRRNISRAKWMEELKIYLKRRKI